MRKGYKKYLGSKEWKSRKERWFKTYPNARCQVCKTDKKLILHHLTYARVGKERDSDLMALCNSCHLKLHNYHRKQRRKSLYRSSMEYIASHSNPKKDSKMLSYKLKQQRQRNANRNRNPRSGE